MAQPSQDLACKHSRQTGSYDSYVHHSSIGWRPHPIPVPPHVKPRGMSFCATSPDPSHVVGRRIEWPVKEPIAPHNPGNRVRVSPIECISVIQRLSEIHRGIWVLYPSSNPLSPSHPHIVVHHTVAHQAHLSGIPQGIPRVAYLQVTLFLRDRRLDSFPPRNASPFRQRTPISRRLQLMTVMVCLFPKYEHLV